MGRKFFIRFFIGLLAGLALTGCVVSTETAPEVKGSETASPYGESEFLGKVTGYGKDVDSFGGDRETTVYVDEKRVDLDLIWPYSAGCMERETLQDNAFLSARDSLQKVLPIGTRVLVIRSNFENEEWIGDYEYGFIHILKKGSEVPQTAPPQDSVNERLVLTGFWVPSAMGFEFDVYKFGATYGTFEPKYLSAKQIEYAPLILEAGNKARSAQVGAMPVCSTLALDYQIDFFYSQVSAFRDDEEEDRLWWVERRKPRNCRDGDGDGICYER